MDNLCSYLDSARRCKTIKLNDFSNALHRITATAGITTSLQVKESFTIGEHIAAFWYVGRKFVWYLGVVDGVDTESDQILISYLKQTDNQGFEWEFPQDADIHPTSEEQILMSSITVTYMCSVKIQCRIVSKEVVNELNAKIKDL